MRRVTAASLESATRAARGAPAIAKEGDITDMFAEPLAPLPACVAPAPAAVPMAPPPAPIETPRPAAWRERLVARFFGALAPREEPSAPDPRVDRLQMRRLGLD